MKKRTHRLRIINLGVAIMMSTLLKFTALLVLRFIRNNPCRGAINDSQPYRDQKYSGKIFSNLQRGSQSQTFRAQERAEVGSSVAENNDFLEWKERHWTSSQLVHEFRGPNKSNWDKIINTMDPSSGKLLQIVIRILSNNEIR
jgi:hypothetical protein